MAPRLFLDINTLLQAPPNIRQVLEDTQRELARRGVNIRIQTPDKDLRAVEGITRRVQDSFKSLGKGADQEFKGARDAIRAYNTAQRSAVTISEELGRQTAITVKRFVGYVIATRALFGLSGALQSAVGNALQLSQEMVKISQLTNTSVFELGSLRNEINNISTEFGISALKVAEAAKTLAQAGKSITEIKTILAQSAPASLTATIGDYAASIESILAIQGQFNLQASQTAAIYDVLNAVTKEYNVSIDELFQGVRRSGAAYAALAGALDEGRVPEENLQSFREYIALFTSIISTTRESAATVGTSLKTIFPRLQRSKNRETISSILGIDLLGSDREPLSPFEQIRKISEALDGVGKIDFARVVESAGGQRQFSRTVALLTQFREAQNALAIAESAGGSVAEDAAKAQQDFLVQMQKVRAEFQKFIDELSRTGTFEDLAKLFIELARSSIVLLNAIKPLVPYLTILLTLQGARGLGGFFTKFKTNFPPNPIFQGRSGGGRVRLAGGGVPVALTPGEMVVPPDEAKRVGYNKLALANSTGNFAGLNVKRFGVVPGTGNTDSYMTSIPSNSFVLKKSVARSYLARSLQFAKGGRVGLATGGLGLPVDPERIQQAQAMQQAIQKLVGLGVTVDNLTRSINAQNTSTKTLTRTLARSVRPGSVRPLDDQGFFGAPGITPQQRLQQQQRQQMIPFPFAQGTQGRTAGDAEALFKILEEEYNDFAKEAAAVKARVKATKVETVAVRGPEQLALPAPTNLTPQLLLEDQRKRNLDGDSIADLLQRGEPLLKDRIQKEFAALRAQRPQDSLNTLFAEASNRVTGSSAIDSSISELHASTIQQFKSAFDTRRWRNATTAFERAGRGVARAGNFLQRPAVGIGAAIIGSQLAQSENSTLRTVGGVVNSATLGGFAGAGIGSMTGTPAGTAVGAVVGVLVGTLTGLASAISEHTKQLKEAFLREQEERLAGVETLAGFAREFDSTRTFENLPRRRFLTPLDTKFVGGDPSLGQAIVRTPILKRISASVLDAVSAGAGAVTGDPLERSRSIELAERQAEKDIGAARDTNRESFERVMKLAIDEIAKEGATPESIQKARETLKDDAPLLALFSKGLRNVTDLSDDQLLKQNFLEVFLTQIEPAARRMAEFNEKVKQVNATIDDWGRAIDLSTGQLNRIAFAFQSFQDNLSQIDSKIAGPASFRAVRDRNVFADVTGVGREEFAQALSRLESRMGGDVGGRFPLLSELASGAQFFANDARSLLFANQDRAGEDAAVVLGELIPDNLRSDVQELLQEQINSVFSGDKEKLKVEDLLLDSGLADQVFGELGKGELQNALGVLAKTADAANERLAQMEGVVNSLNAQILDVDIGGTKRAFQTQDRARDFDRVLLGDDRANLGQARARADRDFRITSGGLNLNESIRQLGALTTGGPLSPEQTLQQNRLIEALRGAADETKTLAEIEKRRTEIEANRTGARTLVEEIATASPERRIEINRELKDFNLLQQGGTLTGDRLAKALQIGEKTLRGQGVDEEAIRRRLDEFLFRGAGSVVGPGEQAAGRRIESLLFPDAQIDGLRKDANTEFGRAAAAQQAVLDAQRAGLNEKIDIANKELGLVTAEEGGQLQSQLRSVFEELSESEFSKGLIRFAEKMENSAFTLEVAPTTVNLNISAPDLAQLANSDAFAAEINSAVQTFIENNASKIASMIANV